MNKITIFLSIIIMALSFSMGAAIQCKAQNKPGFPGVVPFMTSGDHLGFFDQSSGRIFMYDSDISKCTFVGQIHELGQPIDTISK